MSKKELIELRKKLAAGALAGTIALGSLTGCGKNDDKMTYDEFLAQYEQEHATEEASTETQTTESVSEEYVSEGLNAEADASIEEIVDESYEEYQEFYDSVGIDKDQIRNMIFFVNDKYETLTEDELGLAYCNIERIMLPYKVSQKIDNINTIANGDITPEQDGVIIPNIPKISSFVDQNKSGGKITVRKMQEWEEELAKQVKLMNEEGTFDVDSINAFIKKNEVTDYNNDDTGLSSSTVTGFRFVLSDQHKYALRMAGAMQPQVNFIEGNEGIDDIKINAFNEERKIEDLVENLKEENLLDAATSEKVVDYVTNLYQNGETITPQEIAESYGLSIDNSNLLIDYAIYLSTMAFYQYERIDCNLKREALDKRNNLSKDTSMNNNKKKMLVYTDKSAALVSFNC